MATKFAEKIYKQLRTISKGKYIYVPETGEYETVTYYYQSEPRFIRELKNGVKYYFNGDGNLDSIEDANDNTITIVRDEDGRIQSITDSSGLRTIIFTWDGAKITKITDPAANEYNFTYSNGEQLAWYSSWI